MTNGLLFDFQLEFTFSDNWLADLDRQIVLLLSTIEGTMPLERGLGIMQDFVDKPPAVVKSLYTAEAARKISEFIPQVRVQEVIWLPAEQGHFKPKVVITRALQSSDRPAARGQLYRQPDRGRPAPGDGGGL